MFVPLPHRRKSGPRWVTPLLVAILLAGHLWVSTRPAADGQALLQSWAALTGGNDLAATWRLLGSDGRWLRLVTALGLHADWTHLAGNLVFLLIFGLPSERTMGAGRFVLLQGGALAASAYAMRFPAWWDDYRAEPGRERSLAQAPVADAAPEART